MIESTVTDGRAAAEAQADGDPGCSEVQERALVPEGGINGRFPDDLSGETAKIPEYTIDALIDYVEHGRPTGSFLASVLVGDLWGTFRHVDHGNAQYLAAIVGWLRNVPPHLCYGSEAKVAAWAALNPIQRSNRLRQCPTWQDFIAERESAEPGVSR